MLPQYITLTNWRNFDSRQILVPHQSAILIDQNGVGKTSVLSALYSLFTGQPFPGTKFPEFLRGNQQYFGVSTEKPDWSINGQVGPSGRLGVKRNIPEFDHRNVVLTYQPTDNYWFSLSRGQKLKILDDLLAQIYGESYGQLLEKLEKSIKGKTNLLKYYHYSGVRPDVILAGQLHEVSRLYSTKIWEIRQKFFDFLEQKLSDFSGMIQTSLSNWRIKTHIKGAFSSDFSVLWERELIVGKVLFGAQRDDFWIESNHLHVEDVLSRGEMRLLVLFVKHIAIELISDQKIQTIWLLDDVFNELDNIREKLIFDTILSRTDYFLATGTRKPSIDVPLFSILDITTI